MKTGRFFDMVPRILLVNPAIYDFAAYDFWLKPYGLLSVAGFLRGKAEFKLFDYMDRSQGACAEQKDMRSDQWGKGRFYQEKVDSPKELENIPRYFRRFGAPRKVFQDVLRGNRPFEFVFVQTMMTYWYPGIAEVIEDVRRFCPGAKIVLGGNYVTLCREHAKTLGADLLVGGTELDRLWEYVGLKPNEDQPGLWESYCKLEVGVLKLTDGCPFKCTYCSVPKIYGGFVARSMDRCLAELEMLVERGVKNVAFYDDALLFEAERVLMPFLDEMMKRGIKVNFHTPNALNVRFITKELCRLMVRGGFKTFYLGFESVSSRWQKGTGSKVFSDELDVAVRELRAAGAKAENITAYQIIGHPGSDGQRLEESMRFVNSLGIRGMLADFSPIVGTVDGESCRGLVDMDEPLYHNKTAFTIIKLGSDETDRLKDIQRRLNRQLD